MQLTRFAFVLLAVAAGAALWPAPADAHALLVRSAPPADAQLRTPPTRITAWFTEPVERGISVLRVLDGAGQQVDEQQVAFDPKDSHTMSVAVRQNVGTGFYTVTWETLSRIDGHIQFGSFDFTVLNPDGSAPAGPRLPSGVGAADRSPGLAEGALTKFIGLLGAMLLVGGLAFLLVVARPAAGTLATDAGGTARDAASRSLFGVARLSLALLVAAGGAELLLQARQIGGATELMTAVGTTWGGRWLQRQLVLLALAAALVSAVVWRRRRATRAATASLWAALAAGLVYLLLVSAVSHAAAIAAGSFWATAADFIHLLAGAIWIGALLQLTLLLGWSRRQVPDWERPRLLAAALQRFSLLAATSVAVLLASGVFNALVQMPTLGSLTDTAYGRVLSVKIVLLLPLLAVAAFNAVVLRTRVVQAATTTGQIEQLRHRLLRLVTVETALGVAVLLIVGVLVWYPPARSTVMATSGDTQTGAPPVSAAGRFADPLVIGTWGTVAGLGLILAGVLMWIWTAHRPSLAAETRKTLHTLALALPVVGAVLVTAALVPRPGSSRAQTTVRPPVSQQATPSAARPSAPSSQLGASGAAETPGIALRYQTSAGQFVLLEIAPFQLGANTVRMTVLDATTRATRAGGVTLRTSRLEGESMMTAVAAVAAADGRGWIAEAALTETGWWAFDVRVDGQDAASFYLRLDRPSQAPLVFAPPTYQSDRAAETVFRQTVERYEQLTSVRWREELTSGLLAPTGIGAWIVTSGEAAAPDRVHLHVLSPGYSDYELYRVGQKRCTQERGKPWQCAQGDTERALDLELQASATAFQLGRREPAGGEMARVVLFYNPTQPAWYAWWVGEETGYLRKQAMVAPGHFMLARFLDQNVPLTIALPPEAR